MRVVIGANSLQGQLTGIGYYARGLIDSLAQRPEIDELRLLSHGCLSRPLGPASQERDQPLESGSRSPGAISRLAGKLRPLASRIGPLVTLYDGFTGIAARSALRNYSSTDIFHAPDFQFAEFPGKTVVTIPDLSTMTFPEFHPASRVAYINRHIRRAAARADHVVAISDFVRREIIDQLRIPEERVTTIYPGIDPELRPVTEKEFTASGIDVPVTYGNYFIFVSTIEPRKNLKRLLVAFRRYRESEGESALPLLVVGGTGWGSADIHQDLAGLMSEGGVIYPGYIDRKYLRLLLAGARALLFPSIYEGFGLPVVEAMAAGTAVLTTRDSAMSEVAGEAGLLVDASDSDAIFAQIMSLHGDDQLVDRLERAGLESSRRFSWENCANQTVDLYMSLAQCNRQTIGPDDL